jgi:hypothetical protein
MSFREAWKSSSWWWNWGMVVIGLIGLILAFLLVF